MKLDPETEVPIEFWDFIDESFGEEEIFLEKLDALSREKLVLYFLIYNQLQADLADVCREEHSDDASDDFADGAIALGHKMFVTCLSGVQNFSDAAWEKVEKRGRLHVFYSVYESKFEGDLFDSLDPYEGKPWPWEEPDA